MNVLDAAHRSETWLERWSGWGQIIMTLIGWTVIAVWMARGLSDQAEQQAKINSELTLRFSQISDKVLQLSLSTERLTEHAAVLEQDTNRRLERLERHADGKP